MESTALFFFGLAASLLYIETETINVINEFKGLKSEYKNLTICLFVALLFCWTRLYYISTH